MLRWMRPFLFSRDAESSGKRHQLTAAYDTVIWPNQGTNVPGQEEGGGRSLQDFLGWGGQDLLQRKNFYWLGERKCKRILPKSSDAVEGYWRFIWFVYYVWIYSTHLLSSWECKPHSLTLIMIARSLCPLHSRSQYLHSQALVGATVYLLKVSK